MEIKEYWPRHLQELVEFGQIATAEQPEFTKAVQDVQGAPDDFFLVSLSEYGCRRWEAILGLVAAAKYLSTVSDDFKVVLDNDAYELFVRIRLSGYTQRDALTETLKQMIPANLVLLLQTAIPQTVLRPASVVGAAMVNMVRHEHHPEGGNTNGTI